MANSVGHCFVCGKRLVDVMGRPVEGTTRILNDQRVRMHKCCSETFDRDQAKLRQINYTTDQFGQSLGSYEE